ncbi:MAG: aminoglycoside phosphotransferase family protein [Anaerolineae bacterium]|nr:aminoglycoside phosphotransferase family protein [Anaerolineae bacterium]
MESKTKIDLTSELIAHLVVEHFGSQSAVAACLPLKDGWFNTAYRVTLKDGLETVLKVAPPPDVPILTYEKNIMRTEVDVMCRLAAIGDMPIPRFLAVDFSRSTLPSDYYFMELLQGTPLDKLSSGLGDDDHDSIERQKGALAARFHQVHNPGFGYPQMQGEPYTQSWKEAFLQIIANILSDRDRYKVRLPRKSDTIYRIFEHASQLLDGVPTAVLLHFDFWDGNIFITGEPGNYTIEGVIDFERTIWGDPVAELAVNINKSAEALQGSKFLEGYAAVAGRSLLDTEEERRRYTLYRAYMGLIMVIECAPRAYPLALRTWIKTYVYQVLKQCMNQMERF